VSVIDHEDDDLEDDDDLEPEVEQLDDPAEEGDAKPAQIRREYDWPKLRRAYVEGWKPEGAEADKESGTHWPSLLEVAERFNVSPNRVREKSAADGWRDARAAWQAQVEQTRQKRRATQLAAKVDDLDAGALRGAELGVGVIASRLQDIAKAVQAAKLAGVEGGYPLVDSREMKALAEALDLFHRIGLRAVGDVEVQRMEITGANGAPLAVELRRDDPERLVGVLAVLEEAGAKEYFASLGAGGSGLGAPEAIEARSRPGAEVPDS
jgi:hypothetical protein